MDNQVCQHCGKEFSGRKRKYCDHDCCWAAQYARAGKLNPRDKNKTTHCIVCGKELTGRQINFCCSKCKDQNRYKNSLRKHDKNTPLTCIYCGKEFYSERKKKHCSRDCVYKANLERAKGKRASKAELFAKTCLICGKEYQTALKTQKYCGHECRDKRTNRISTKPKGRLKNVVYVCKNCGIDFHPKAKQYNTYCSRGCAVEDKKANARGRVPRPAKPKKQFVCVVCGSMFESSCSFAKYCGTECRRVAGLIQGHDNRYSTPRKCKWCEKMFIPEVNAKTWAYCCEEHRELAVKEHDNRHGISKAKRKRIYLRDGCKCKLCGKPMRMDKIHTLGTSNPHPLAPTIDHIIPKSIARQQGWTKHQIHDDSNLQAAHWQCNIDKGVSAVGEQILLFG